MHEVQWTPYTGQPIKNGSYLCTVVSTNGYKWVAPYDYYRGTWNWHDTLSAVRDDNHVIAIMPFPKPYQGT